MKEDRNVKDLTFQPDLFPETKVSEIEDSWFVYPYGWCNLDDAVLRSFAGYVPASSCTPRQASRAPQLRIVR
jgi:hypothetical protein